MRMFDTNDARTRKAVHSFKVFAVIFLTVCVSLIALVHWVTGCKMDGVGPEEGGFQIWMHEKYGNGGTE